MQIKAGFKKEWMLFTRTGKLVGVILAIIAFSIFDPVMLKLTSVMMGMMSDMTTEIITNNGKADIPSDKPLITAGIITLSESGTASITVDELAAVNTSISGEMSGIDESLQDSLDLMDSMSSMFTKDYAFASTMAECYSLSLLIVMLVLMTTAGGEMKKRSTIIPDCSGLEPFNYITPKFILYPITVFVTTMVGTLIAYGMCSALFEGELDLLTCLGSGALTGGYLVFMIVLMLTIGLCTSKPGIATICVFIGSSILPILLSSMELIKFSPFALRFVAQDMTMGGYRDNDFALNVAVSIVITLVLCVVFYWITGVVLKARKINNLGEMKPHF